MEVKNKMVIYTDGSGKLPYSGYGYFGYTYNEVDVVKASKPKGYRITERGFLELSGKASPHKEVTPHIYHVGAFSEEGEGTNNTGETLAIVRAIELATEKEVTEVYVLTDSTYAIGMFNKVESNDIRNIQANSHIAEMMLKAYNAFTGVVIVNKVLAHSDNFGNDTADVLALYGRLFNSKRTTLNLVKDFSPKKFFNPTSDKHPYSATYKNYIFNTSEKYKNFYGLHTLADIDEAGKIDIDSIYAVMSTPEAIPILDKLYRILTRLTKSFTVPALVNLRNLYSPDALFFRNMLEDEDGLYTFIKGVRRPLTILEELEVGSLVKPVGRGMEDSKIIKELTGQLDSVLNSPAKQYVISDITKSFYEDGKLLPSITNEKIMKISHTLKDGKTIVVPVKAKLDTPERNVLNKVAKDAKLLLITEEIEGVVTYVTVLMSPTHGSIITSNYYSNKIFL